jgi:hypothetical protein
MEVSGQRHDPAIFTPVGIVPRFLGLEGKWVPFWKIEEKPPPPSPIGIGTLVIQSAANRFTELSTLTVSFFKNNLYLMLHNFCTTTRFKKLQTLITISCKLGAILSQLKIKLNSPDSFWCRSQTLNFV